MRFALVRSVFGGNNNTIDGCATFFRRCRFSLVKEYEFEFNEAAWDFTKDKTLSNLLVKANTHVNARQEWKAGKLWQVHTLLKMLRKNVSVDIPKLVCGDFNSVPGSAPHALLATGKVDPSHPDLPVDPLTMLVPHSKLVHQLLLASAYSSLARTTDPGLEQHRRRLDGTTNEPLFTNITRDFMGTLDYIFYTADSLVVDSLLELLDEETFRKDTALPLPEWSSDHIALLAKFRCCKN